MISLTLLAAAELRTALSAKDAEGFGLRVQVVGGGCEGFLYDLLFVDGAEADDVVFESQGLKIFVSRKTLPVVDGLTIDHGKTAYGEGLLFSNPSARSRCSCGASFGT